MATATDELMLQALSLLQNKVAQCAQMLQKKNEVMMWKGQVIAAPDDTQKTSMDDAVKELLTDIQTVVNNLDLTAKADAVAASALEAIVDGP